jgi:hypothetical protein
MQTQAMPGLLRIRGYRFFHSLEVGVHWRRDRYSSGADRRRYSSGKLSRGAVIVKSSQLFETKNFRVPHRDSTRHHCFMVGPWLACAALSLPNSLVFTKDRTRRRCVFHTRLIFDGSLSAYLSCSASLLKSLTS